MKKALYVATVDLHIRSFHLPYLKILHDMGYEVHVATNGNERFDYCDIKHTICIERSPFKFKNIKAIKELKKIINREKFDLIHCHTPMGSVVTRIAAKKARQSGTRVIYTAHGFHFYKGAPLINWLLFYPVEKYLSKYTDVLITINREDYEYASSKFKKTNVEYIPGVGLDTKKYDIDFSNDDKKKLRDSLGLKKNDYVLTCVARLDKNKNQIFLIDVIEKIINKNNNVHLLLAGRDELNGYYQNIVKEKNLSNNIHFLGNRDDVPELLSITNVVLSASKREGLPVNIMEAFASGKPVVALNCRGMQDLIENGINGYIISNNSIDDFVEKINEILTNKTLNNYISNNNIESINKFSLVTVIKKMKTIYKLK